MLNLRPLVGVVSLFAAFGSLAADFAIHDGDRVVFLGDSITEQRLYTTYIEAYALTRHPLWQLTFRNVGWGGDTAWLRQRAHPDEGRLFAANDTDLQSMVENSVGRGLGRDVLPLKPTFVTVKFGMNDHSYQAFRPDIFRAYARSQSEIAKVLGGAGVRVAFLTPQPIEDKRPDPDKDPRNQSLRQFSDGLKDVAAKGNAAFVDQFAPYMDLMLAERAKNPDAIIGGGDAVHPGPPGQTLMAWAVLKGLGATPSVSKAELQVAAKSATSMACKVDNITVADGGVAFDRLDEALPMPIDSRAEAALKLAPVLDELSQYTLGVVGLAGGNYEISIDGEAATKASAAELAKGINLSLVAGPITKQTREVLALVFHKNDRYFERWRNVQLYSFPGWAKGPEAEARRDAELKRVDDEIAADEAKIDAARKPRKHRFEIKPVAP
uniref:Putative GDSL family lipase n=1 Tax=uncultured prokaryote EC6 TaxID=672204 RepID=D3W8K7_9ZZZZ|nr:putative GDSL family lipase [uncultured prokaryote EC6]